MEWTSSDGVALVRMKAGKANAIGPSFLVAFARLLAEIGASDARATVLTGDGRVFGAGLALPELFALERDAMRTFMESFEAVMETLWTMPIPFVAAIDGPAIAGGCVIALQCDRRLMASDAKRIGLTEIALGIGLPPSVAVPLHASVPVTSLAPIALEGKLFAPDEARALALIDEVCPRESLEARALALAGSLGANGPAYGQIKLALRAPALERMRATRAEGLERWLDTWFSPLGRERLGAAVEKLAAKQ